MPTFQGFKSKSPPPVKEVCQLNIDWSIVCLPSGPKATPCTYASILAWNRDLTVPGHHSNIYICHGLDLKLHNSQIPFWFCSLPAHGAVFGCRFQWDYLATQHSRSPLNSTMSINLPALGREKRRKTHLHTGSSLTGIHLTATSAKFCPILSLFLYFAVVLALLLCLNY